jgi:hypothetical protein
MSNVLKFNDYINEVNAGYAGEWPLNKQTINYGDGDVANNPDFARSENKFQEVQEYMKLILKPIILKKNLNAEDIDIEKISDSFFRLGNNKSQEIKKMVDGCKDTKQCARDIVDKYLKYVKINFNSKDDINDVEQDSVMSSENLKYIKKFNNISNINEVKRTPRMNNLSDVETVPGFGVKYHNEIFPNINIPKRYVGKGKFKYRVLAKEGNRVKPINFGDKTRKPERHSMLSKKYWDSIPYYR